MEGCQIFSARMVRWFTIHKFMRKITLIILEFFLIFICFLASLAFGSLQHEPRQPRLQDGNQLVFAQLQEDVLGFGTPTTALVLIEPQSCFHKLTSEPLRKHHATGSQTLFVEREIGHSDLQLQREFLQMKG